MFWGVLTRALKRKWHCYSLTGLTYDLSNNTDKETNVSYEEKNLVMNELLGLSTLRARYC
jgi:hypothetical protein